MDKGILGAHCEHTNTQQTRDIDYSDWRDLSFGQICTADPADKFGATFADVKATVEKLCSKCNCCTYQQKTFLNKVINLQKHAGDL